MQDIPCYFVKAVGIHNLWGKGATGKCLDSPMLWGKTISKIDQAVGCLVTGYPIDLM